MFHDILKIMKPLSGGRRPSSHDHKSCEISIQFRNFSFISQCRRVALQSQQPFPILLVKQKKSSIVFLSPVLKVLENCSKHTTQQQNKKMFVSCWFTFHPIVIGKGLNLRVQKISFSLECNVPKGSLFLHTQHIPYIHVVKEETLKHVESFN